MYFTANGLFNLKLTTRGTDWLHHPLKKFSQMWKRVNEVLVYPQEVLEGSEKTLYVKAFTTGLGT